MIENAIGLLSNPVVFLAATLTAAKIVVKAMKRK